MENICIINESDIPYKINISDIEKKYFLKIAKKIKKKAKVNLGICVLYNDWKATLDIAKAINAQFVRIDTFVDLVESDAGIIYPEAEKIKEHQNKI
ncbi:MAG: BtpA/SgcQ family protein [bacterium]